MDINYIKVPKALQKDVLFYGLRAKYVEKAIKGMVVCIVLGMIMSNFISGIVAGLLSFAAAFGFFSVMLFFSRLYGENGFVKKEVERKMPDEIKGHVNKRSLLVWKGK